MYQLRLDLTFECVLLSARNTNNNIFLNKLILSKFYYNANVP